MRFYCAGRGREKSSGISRSLIDANWKRKYFVNCSTGSIWIIYPGKRIICRSLVLFFVTLFPRTFFTCPPKSVNYALHVGPSSSTKILWWMKVQNCDAFTFECVGNSFSIFTRCCMKNGSRRFHCKVLQAFGFWKNDVWISLQQHLGNETDCDVFWHSIWNFWGHCVTKILI